MGLAWPPVFLLVQKFGCDLVSFLLGLLKLKLLHLLNLLHLPIPLHLPLLIHVLTLLCSLDKRICHLKMIVNVVEEIETNPTDAFLSHHCLVEYPVFSLMYSSMCT